jgi:hypothetical protein
MRKIRALAVPSESLALHAQGESVDMKAPLLSEGALLNAFTQ